MTDTKSAYDAYWDCVTREKQIKFAPSAGTIGALFNDPTMQMPTRQRVQGRANVPIRQLTPQQAQEAQIFQLVHGDRIAQLAQQAQEKTLREQVYELPGAFVQGPAYADSAEGLAITGRGPMLIEHELIAAKAKRSKDELAQQSASLKKQRKELAEALKAAYGNPMHHSRTGYTEEETQIVSQLNENKRQLDALEHQYAQAQNIYDMAKAQAEAERNAMEKRALRRTMIEQYGEPEITMDSAIVRRARGQQVYTDAEYQQAKRQELYDYWEPIERELENADFEASYSNDDQKAKQVRDNFHAIREARKDLEDEIAGLRIQNGTVRLDAEKAAIERDAKTHSDYDRIAQEHANFFEWRPDARYLELEEESERLEQEIRALEARRDQLSKQAKDNAPTNTQDVEVEGYSALLDQIAQLDAQIEQTTARKKQVDNQLAPFSDRVPTELSGLARLQEAASRAYHGDLKDVQYLTADEARTLLFLYDPNASWQSDTYNRYLDLLKLQLEGRRAREQGQEDAEKEGLSKTLAVTGQYVKGAAGELGDALGNLDPFKWLDPNRDDLYLYQSGFEAYREVVDPTLTFGQRAVANVAAGVVHMAPTLIAYAINPTLGIATTGVTSGARAYHSAKRQGYTDATALQFGIATGVIEAASNRLLGGINPAGGGNLSKTVLSNLKQMLPQAVQTMVAKIGTSALVRAVADMTSEGLEEYVQFYLDGWLENQILGKDNQFELLSEQAMFDAFVGGLTAAILNLPDTISRGASNIKAIAQSKKARVAPMVSETTGDQPIKVGRATAIKSPYKGLMPTYNRQIGEKAPIEISQESVQNATIQIETAKQKSAAESKSFRKYIKDFYNAVFDNSGGVKTVKVDDTTFGGEDYYVIINKNAIGKIVSDPNLSVEKLALLDDLESVVKNGEYVGSGDYVQHGNRQKQTIRFDYFETPVKINGEDYTAAFDVEVFPEANNYRTHKVIKNMDLVKTSSTDTGPVPAAQDATLNPYSNGSDIPPVANSIPQNGDAVNGSIRTNAEFMHSARGLENDPVTRAYLTAVIRDGTMKAGTRGAVRADAPLTREDVARAYLQAVIEQESARRAKADGWSLENIQLDQGGNGIAQIADDVDGGRIETEAEKEGEYGVPYGDVSIKADIDYINSDKYAKKYNITDNDAVNESLLKCVRASIAHRNGTKFEDMYIINANTGEVMGSQTEMQYESGIEYNDSIISALNRSKEESIPIIAIHNHPEGLPPSIDDFNKAFENNYQLGIVCGHNGQVYLYNRPSNIINNPKLIHEIIAQDCERGIDVDRAHLEMYKLLKLSYTILRGEDK